MQLRFSGSLLTTACVLLAACASETGGGTSAGNTELNLDIVNPGGTSGELGFSIDRVDYRITCAGGAYLLPPFHDLPSAPNGTECSTADLDNNGIPDSCPVGFNYIQGGAGADNLVGTTGADCIYGLGGNDTINGGNGGDYICGGPGADTIDGGNGNDTIHGGDGNDTINGGNGIDALFGDGGDDTLDAGGANDLLDGGPGIDTLNGGSGTDTCSQEVAGSSSRLTSCESNYDDSVNISGSFEVVDTRTPPVWQAVMDLPPGDCTVTLSVWDGDEIACVGSQTLPITEDATQKFDIVLVCSLSIDTPDGMADIDGTFEYVTGNLCPKLYVLNAIPSDVDIAAFPPATEVQYRAKDPDNGCGHNCDPQSCTGANPPVCTPYPSNIQDPVCNPTFGGDPNDPTCLAGDHAGLVCTLAAIASASGAPGGTFISPLDGVTPVGPVLPVNLNTSSGVPGVILPGLGGPVGTSSEGSPVFPPTFPTDQLPPLVYVCDTTLPGAVIMNLTCSDGDLECDQNKQITVVCPGTNFCDQQPIDCSAPSGTCITGGTCIPQCDPADLGGPACTGPAGREWCDGYGVPVADGTACTEGGGQVCLGGACVECLSDSDCTDLPAPPDVCQLPNTCDLGTNSCVAGGTAPAGTLCSNGECDGVGTGSGACQFLAFPQGPFQKDITLGCTNNLTTDISILPWQLVAGGNTPTIVAGNPVTMEYTGTAFFTESFLDAGLAAVPGLSQAALAPGNRGGATIVEYGGGLSGPDVEIQPAPIPTTCSGGMNAGGACVTSSDCPPVGYFQCLEIVQIPTIDGTGDACAACNALGPPKDTQCADNGYCIAPGGLPLPLDTVSGNYTAVGGNPIHLGWVDTNFVSIAGDGTYNLPAASFAAPWQPAGLRVVVGILQIALNCNMAVDSGGPLGVGVPDKASPTPTSALLNDFVVQVP